MHPYAEKRAAPACAPHPLPELPSVASFGFDLLPDAFRPWIEDISERLQCPPDFPALAAMVAAAGVVGCRIGVRPQEHTDWIEMPNLWGLGVGRPGVMKTPAFQEALKPIKRLEAQARTTNLAASAEYSERAAIEDLKRKALKDAAKRMLKDDPSAEVELGGATPNAPPERRYLVIDATYEALGLVLRDNPHGVLCFRDEIIGMIAPLGREENAPARGFFLQGWDGKGSYSFDRLSREKVYIPNCCLSLLGSTQPARLDAYTRDAIQGGSLDDGFMQRFSFAIWPDVAPTWENVDRPALTFARERAEATFDRLAQLDPLAIGAETMAYEATPFLRFAPEARENFEGWRSSWEAMLRSGDLHPALESHFSKYRKLVPALALLCHVIDQGDGPISNTALMRALRWSQYLRSHANRIYSAATGNTFGGARTILDNLVRGRLPKTFRARDVHQKNWAGLSERPRVKEALELLVEYDWLIPEEVETGGRPTVEYSLNTLSSFSRH